jgi:hypothetical protein
VYIELRIESVLCSIPKMCKHHRVLVKEFNSEYFEKEQYFLNPYFYGIFFRGFYRGKGGGVGNSTPPFGVSENSDIKKFKVVTN